MDPFLRVIELLAVLTSGTYGVLLARRKGMDFVGVFAVAFIIALGGGTTRDLFLDRHPLFWIEHEVYPLMLFGLAAIMSLFRKLPAGFSKWLHVPDAFGLGLFCILGTSLALEAGSSWFVASLLGVVTGTFGGVIGDVICNEVPSLFTTSPLYATCAFLGSWGYMLTGLTVLGESVAVLVGLFIVVVMRLFAVHFNLQLPNRAQG